MPVCRLSCGPISHVLQAINQQETKRAAGGWGQVHPAKISLFGSARAPPQRVHRPFGWGSQAWRLTTLKVKASHSLQTASLLLGALLGFVLGR